MAAKRRRVELDPTINPEINAPLEECEVVASLICHGDLLPIAREVVSAEDFRDVHARSCYQAICALADSADAVDYATVVHQLQRDGTAWPAVLVDLVGWIEQSWYGPIWAGSPVTMRRLCEDVATAAERRRLLGASSKVASAALSSDLDAEGAVKAATEAVTSSQRRRSAAAELLGPEDFAHLAAIRNVDAQSGQSDAIAFGLVDLDEATSGGARPGQLIVVGGRTGMGKSSLLRYLAHRFARRGLVLFASNEMGLVQIAERDIAVLSGIPLSRVVKGNWRAEEQDRIAWAEDALSQIQVVNYQDSAMTSATLRQRAAELHARTPLVAIVVDYLQRMADPGKTDLERVSGTARALKSLALELGLPVVAGSQLSRATEQNVDARPTLTDLRNSGEIEQEADLALLIHNWGVLFPTADAWRRAGKKGDWPGHVADILIAKQRQGASGIDVRVAWLPQVATFADLARGGDR